MEKLNNDLNLTFALVIIYGIIFFVACKRSDSKTLITGCKDPKALNYNSKADVAAPCHYTISGFSGKYYMTDTEIQLNHDYTLSWYDTSYSHYYINCSVLCSDSMYFDTLIHCPYCASKNIVVSADNGSFSFDNSTTPVDYSGYGYFRNDTLFFHYGATATYGFTGSDTHNATGKKQ